VLQSLEQRPGVRLISMLCIAF